MSDLLSIGASGVRAYQTALTATSENIANAGTVGYSRRTATLRDIAPGGSMLSGASSLNGNGVLVSGIARSADAYRAAQVRSSGAELARTQGGIVWMERIESALTQSALSDRLGAFFDAATKVAADPASNGPRATMLESAAALASAFRATGSALDAAAAELDSTAEEGVRRLNELSAALASVNSSLGRGGISGSTEANLLDERDRLLESMSALSEISVETDPVGRATVRAGGSGGPILVAGDSVGIVTYVRNDEGAVSLAVHRGGEQSNLVPNGGALGGVVDGATRIAHAQGSLRNIAAALVEGVNAVQAQGVDLNGSPGAAMFELGEGAGDVQLALNDARGIAAAGPGGSVNDAGNLARLAALREDGGFEDGLTGLITGNASALAGRRTVAEAQVALHDGAVAARDAVSGVNLDEEAVSLLRFQQAYQASSRVIQVARDTLQTIFDIR